MRVGIIQSNFIPWRGYFDFIDDVDVFIVYDDVQYTDRDWRNRNRLKTRRGLEWISVSVKQTSRDQLVQEIPIDWSVNWVTKHLNRITENYRDAPYFSEIFDEFSSLLEQRPPLLSDLNRSLLAWVMRRLEITTPLVNSASLPGEGRKTERLLSLTKAIGGTSYLSGPSAASYLDFSAFEKAGIAVEFKTYDYRPYSQLWGSFEGGVSVLDLLMNTGPDARRYIKSLTQNQRATAFQ